MTCTFYSPYTGFNEILERVKKFYPKSEIEIAGDKESQIAVIEIKGGFLQPSKRIRITYRELTEPVSNENDSPLGKNLKGLYGYLQSLPAKNQAVRDQLLKKVLTIFSEFSVIEDKGETSELKPLIKTIAQDFDAFIFAEPGTIISRSPHQHFLDKNLSLIIDAAGDCEIEELESLSNGNEEQAELTADQLERKEKNDALLHDLNIKVNKYLPCIESEQETTIRSAKEIAERIVVLAVTNMVAFNNITADMATEYLKEYELWDKVTPKEKAFLADPTDQKKLNETWKCEGIWVLMWALNRVNELGFPDALCDLNKIPYQEYPVGADKDPNDFIDLHFDVRSKAEILDTNDLYYRFDWACVDARINNQTIETINPSIVYERHYALNWLINYMDSDWDEVTCDT